MAKLSNSEFAREVISQFYVDILTIDIPLALLDDGPEYMTSVDEFLTYHTLDWIKKEYKKWLLLINPIEIFLNTAKHYGYNPSTRLFTSAILPKKLHTFLRDKILIELMLMRLKVLMLNIIKRTILIRTIFNFEKIRLPNDKINFHKLLLTVKNLIKDELLKISREL